MDALEREGEAAKTKAAAPGCGSRALWGWSPMPLPADTALKRRVDRLLPSTGRPLAVFFAAVVVLLIVAPLFARRAELAFDAVAALFAGGWCAVNFWRCRHAHCLVTGVGWLGLSLFAFVEAGVGRSLIRGDEQLVFLGVLAIGLVFEAAWSRRHDGNAITQNS
jgi:hypothetical protein